MLLNTITLVFALALTSVVDASALGARLSHDSRAIVDRSILASAAKTRHNFQVSRMKTRQATKARRCKAKGQGATTKPNQTNSEPKPEEPKPAPAPVPKENPPAAPEAAPEPPKPKPAPPPPPKSSTTSSSDVEAYLNGHNSVRAAHGAVDLTWSDELAAAAQKWANNCQFKHSGGSLGPFGENLAAGSGGFSIQDGIKAWADEEPQYDPGNPQPSHFTQMVWKATTEVGCAVQSCNLDNFDPKFWPVKYYVCEYKRQGNVIGQFPQNVQK